MGASFSLFSTAARRLGLKITPPARDYQPGPGQISAGWTGPCKLDIGSSKIETYFSVVELPTYLKWPEDGTVGWPAISNNIFSLDCITHEITFLTNAPEASVDWVKFHIQTISGDLTLEQLGDKGVKKIIAIDSGSPYGIELRSQEWRQWKANHTNQPTSMLAYYMINPGLLVSEEIWAHEITVGPLVLTDVSVMEANPRLDDLFSSAQAQFQATLGFAALKRLEVIIDGKRGIAYLRPRQTPALPHEHDRLGAAFIPRDPQNDDLVAHVADESPAYEAGIRNDDVLLKIGELDATKCRTDPKVLPLAEISLLGGGTDLFEA